MEPTTENIWYLLSAATDAQAYARVGALCQANDAYRDEYLPGLEGSDVEQELPFPHAQQVLETVRSIGEQRPDLWQGGKISSSAVRDAMDKVGVAADSMAAAWQQYREAITDLDKAVSDENPVMGAP